MSGNLNSNHIESDEFNLKTKQSDYEKLITRLKEISATISLLDKEYLTLLSAKT